MKRTFTKVFLLEEVLGNKDVVRLDKLSSRDRWSLQHRLVFEHEGKLYETYYSVGATEYQDEGPWENEKEVECVEVEVYERVVNDYRRVADAVPPV